jgi:hypothetical protein
LSEQVTQFFVAQPAVFDIAAERGEDLVEGFLRQEVYAVSPLSALLDECGDVVLERHAVFGRLTLYGFVDVGGQINRDGHHGYSLPQGAT